jgi:hypothetical protein
MLKTVQYLEMIVIMENNHPIGYMKEGSTIADVEKLIKRLEKNVLLKGSIQYWYKSVPIIN